MTSFRKFSFLVVAYLKKKKKKIDVEILRRKREKKTINYIAFLPFLLRNMTPRTDYLRVQEFNDEWKEERKDESQCNNNNVIKEM